MTGSTGICGFFSEAGSSEASLEELDAEEFEDDDELLFSSATGNNTGGAGSLIGCGLSDFSILSEMVL